MEFNITELMNDYIDHEFSPVEDRDASIERIKAMTMEKLGRAYAKPVRKLGRTLLIAAVLVAVLAVAALAVYQYGVKDILTEKGISLTGDKTSPEYQANQEWNAYVDEYMETFDRDDAEKPEGYGNYQVYNQEMADVLDTIAEKYQLELHATSIPFGTEEEAYELLGTEDFLLLEHDRVTGYAYGNGTFKMENAALLNGESVDYTIFASEKGILNEVRGVEDLGSYEEWTYKTKSGATVNLVLGGNNSLILLGTEDSYITVSIQSGTLNIAPRMEEYEEAVESIAASGTPVQTAEEMYAEFQRRWSDGRVLFTREMLEEFADGIDFEVLGNIKGFGDAVYEDYQNEQEASRAAYKLFAAAEDELGSFCLSTEAMEEFPYLTNEGMPSDAEEGTAAYAVWRFEAGDGRYILLRYQWAEGTLDDMAPQETPENGTLERAGVGGDVGPDEAYLVYDEKGELKKLMWIDEAKELLFVLETVGASEEDLHREARYLISAPLARQEVNPEVVYAQIGEYEIADLSESFVLNNEIAYTSGEGQNWFGCVRRQFMSGLGTVLLFYETVSENTTIEDYAGESTVSVSAYTTVNGQDAILTESLEAPLKDVSWIDQEKGLYFYVVSDVYDDAQDLIALAETVTLAE